MINENLDESRLGKAHYLFSSLQQSANNAHVTVLGSRVNGASPLFVWHVQIDALLEEHRRALRVSVERRYVHQRRAVLRTLEDAGLELVSE